MPPPPLWPLAIAIGSGCGVQRYLAINSLSLGSARNPMMVTTPLPPRQRLCQIALDPIDQAFVMRRPSCAISTVAKAVSFPSVFAPVILVGKALVSVQIMAG